MSDTDSSSGEPSDPGGDPSLLTHRERLKMALLTIAIVIILLVGLGAWGLFEDLYLGKSELRDLLIDNFVLVFGLPIAASVAFGAVLMFVSDTKGHVSFKMFGLEFSGPGGPLILWVVSLL